MASANRTVERQAALRFCLLTAAWLACAFTWGSLLSFNVADPPSTLVWPNASPVRNLCGPVGASLAYLTFTYLGWGGFAVLTLLTAALGAASNGAPLTDAWLRFIGLLMVGAACACGATLLVSPTEHDVIYGPGGVVGAGVAPFLLEYFQDVGAWLVISLTLVIGSVLAADSLLAAFFQGAAWAGKHGAPVIVRGGTAVVNAGAAVATGIGTLATRIATPSANGDEEDRAPTRPESGTRPRSRPAVAARKNLPVLEEADDDIETLDEVEPLDEDETPERPSKAAAAKPAARAPAPAKKPPPTVDEEEDEPAPPSKAPPPADPDPPPLAVRSTALKPPAPPKKPTPPKPRTDENYVLPSIELLERAIPMDRAAIEHSCREKARVLEQTLNEFRLEVQVVAIDTGPVVTMFELRLAAGIKVSQIASLSNDMARALKAPAVRVVAPLPGKSTIGIEVPNVDKEKVRLRDIIEQFADKADSQGIPLYLGKDASGAPLVSDLTRMPHLLIAGTTGSGKSVCVGSIIMSVLMLRSPSEVHMIMIDPKVVELSMYKDVPHLVCPIVTEMTKAAGILEWASTKMDERYELLAEVGVKDIRSYNRLGAAGLRERLNIESDEELGKVPVRLPFIVIIIDELADLMMTSPKETEFHLCRIAQKSRAVGIHLIVATQRPQANVVTGLIKANLPSRICFRVASRLDSRIVLDQNGGEVLMGQGDMMFLPPGSSKLVRAQGTFVDDDELRAVVRYCKEQRAQEFLPELVRQPGAGDSGGERDELFDEAVDAIVASQRGSVSLLQRKFNIGYSRASRLVDQMYAAGIVGEYKGSQAREVLMTKDEWEALKAQRNREEAEEE